MIKNSNIKFSARYYILVVSLLCIRPWRSSLPVWPDHPLLKFKLIATTCTGNWRYILFLTTRYIKFYHQWQVKIIKICTKLLYLFSFFFLKLYSYILYFLLSIDKTNFITCVNMFWYSCNFLYSSNMYLWKYTYNPLSSIF
jgi:hypothetical protein